MLFQHVAIAGLAHIDAPRRLSTDEINTRLKPTLDRLGIKTDVLQDVAGIHARRLWDADTVNFHPLTNTATTALDQTAFRRVLVLLGRDPLVVDFEAPER